MDKRIAFLCCAICFSSILASAQWVENTLINTPVCTEFGKQNDVRLLGDDHHGAFLAWKDARYGNNNPDIYVQHLDSLGIPQWGNNGMVICDDTTDQSTPNLCTDGEGGFILTWSDIRSGLERDVYAQRINSEGQVLWQSNGVPVADKPIREHNEKITSDDNGGAYIVWEQLDETTQLWNIALQHINSQGIRLWSIDGLVVSEFTANRLNPKLQKDKQGGVYIVWQEMHNGLDYDIYAQRINANGEKLWGNSGLPIAESMNSQINPKMDPDTLSGGVYIAWADKRNQLDYDIYAQRVDSLGNALWTENGLNVCSDIGNQSAVDIISTTQTNGLILTWRDGRSGNNDIYVQKLTPLGLAEWDNQGMLISTSPYNQINPNICSDGANGCIITWQDSTFNDWDVKSQKINGDGQIQWLENGLTVSDAIEIQGHPKNIPDGFGGSIYAWQDKRANQYDIYAHHVNADGTSGANGIESRNTKSTYVIYPNPSSSGFQISGGNYQQVTIYSAVGQRLFSGNQLTGFDEKSISAGAYIVVIKSNSEVEQQVWIKQ